MENKKSRTGHYNSLIWLLLSSYENEQYTPSKYVLDTIGASVKDASNGLPIEVLDSTLYDFRISNSVKDYFSLFLDTAAKFENSLIILSYTSDKYIVRDYYLANLAKQYTCWDTVYINCANPEKITTKVFDWILTPSDLPDGLTNIINNDNNFL